MNPSFEMNRIIESINQKNEELRHLHQMLKETEEKARQDMRMNSEPRAARVHETCEAEPPPSRYAVKKLEGGCAVVIITGLPLQFRLLAHEKEQLIRDLF